MSTNKLLKPISIAISTAVVSVAATGSVSAADVNPFGMNELSNGYMQLAAEGKCGEGKCGGKMKGEKGKEGKCGEGKCGEEMKAKMAKDGKCGEGKCGEGKSGEGKSGAKK